jgi:hypothetical protein
VVKKAKAAFSERVVVGQGPGERQQGAGRIGDGVEQVIGDLVCGGKGKR